MHRSKHPTLDTHSVQHRLLGEMHPHPREHPSISWEHTYTFSQPLPDLDEAHKLPNGDTHWLMAPTVEISPPDPIPWTPRFLPEEWIYTDGSYSKGHPRLGAAVVHIPTRTTMYIDATGCEETRTIMRAELVAIHTALSKFEDHPWIGVFADSLSNLHAIRLHCYSPDLAIAPHYHHHMLLLQSISNLLETHWGKDTPRPYEKSGRTHTSGATTLRTPQLNWL